MMCFISTFALLLLLGQHPCAALLRKPSNARAAAYGTDRNDESIHRDLAAYTTVDGVLYNISMIGAAAAFIDDGSPLGKVTLWSAGRKYQFSPVFLGQTWTTDFDPMDGSSTELLVEDTDHDMFCPGTSMLHDGSYLITGGSTTKSSTLYDPYAPAGSRWTKAPNMIIGRGYHSMTTLTDGTVFTVGGSFSGGEFEKVAEVYDPFNKEWRPRPGIFANGTMNTDDVNGIFRSDNHMWFFQANNGMVFHAGPSKFMHWLDVNGGVGGVGRVINAGVRNIKHQMNGNAIYVDALAGKILTLGGAENYVLAAPTRNAHIVELPNTIDPVNVRPVGQMNYERALCNSIVLPSGEVVVTGGQERMVTLFTDRDGVLPSEIFDPVTETFSVLPSHADLLVARNYHGVALLMKDGRVLVGGGGLCDKECGPAVDHYDVQIITPPYLINSDGSLKVRPVIVNVNPTDTFYLGGTIQVTMDTFTAHTFSLVRYGAVTHSVNNDQRLIPLHDVTSTGGGMFTINIPNIPNALIPGKYFLFAMNSNGVPSIGHVMTRFFQVPAPGPINAPPVLPEYGSCSIQSDCVYLQCVLEREDTSSNRICCSQSGYSDLIGLETPETRVCFNRQPAGTICSHNNFCQSEKCAHTLEDASSPMFCCDEVNWVPGNFRVCRNSIPDGEYCSMDRVCASNSCVNNACVSTNGPNAPPTKSPTKSPNAASPSVPTKAPIKQPTGLLGDGSICTGHAACQSGSCSYEKEGVPLVSEGGHLVCCSLDGHAFSDVMQVRVCKRNTEDGEQCSKNTFCKSYWTNVENQCALEYSSNEASKVCCPPGGFVSTPFGNSCVNRITPNSPTKAPFKAPITAPSKAPTKHPSKSPTATGTCTSAGDCGMDERCVPQFENATAQQICCSHPDGIGDSGITGGPVCKNQQIPGGICSKNIFCQSGQCAHERENANSQEVCCQKNPFDNGLIVWIGALKVCRYSVPNGEYCTDNRVCQSGKCTSNVCN